MRKSTILDLKCPKINRKRCSGNLKVEILSQKNDEIIDGFLICQACKSKYPIIQSIPILLNNLREYLKSEFRNISKTIGGDKKIHQEVFSYIIDLTNATFDEGFFSPGEGQLYVAAQYGTKQQCRSRSSSLFNKWLKSYQKNSLREVIKRWISENNLKDEKAIDIGCAAGGFTYLLAQKCSFSYGVDISFASLFTANRIIKQIPTKLKYYLAVGEEKEVKIKIKKLDNIDFILASADNLPFKNKTFGLALVSYIIDVEKNNFMILKEVNRTLDRGAGIFLSFVPFFRYLKYGNRKLLMDEENIKVLMKSFNFYQVLRPISVDPRFLQRSVDCFMLGKKVN